MANFIRAEIQDTPLFAGTELLASEAKICRTFFSRLRGLIGRKRLLRGEALVIPHCRSVHMFFMTFPIDVLFCTEDGTVIGIEHSLRPWRVSRMFLLAYWAVELPAGTAAHLQITEGARISTAL